VQCAGQLHLSALPRLGAWLLMVSSAACCPHIMLRHSCSAHPALQVLQLKGWSYTAQGSDGWWWHRASHHRLPWVRQGGTSVPGDGCWCFANAAEAEPNALKAWLDGANIFRMGPGGSAGVAAHGTYDWQFARQTRASERFALLPSSLVCPATALTLALKLVDSSSLHCEHHGACALHCMHACSAYHSTLHT